ncbi:Bgt-20767-2 [Blumeria graminis f. sp. tritici]|uniref:Bgt-20767-2 n=1 Tax=Blumeria graminis f. sp. tritici TaxID=62690 RepID=A0A9X9QBM6_BLUGR|nr:Bgt-20767-2 [Blumeria graminis f. sp. tritici]
MRPILERFRTKYSPDGRLSKGKFHLEAKKYPAYQAALEEFFNDLYQYGSKSGGRNEELPHIPLIYVKLCISDKNYDLSIFNHLIYAIEKNYEETFILQTCINLVGILTCTIFPPLAFQRIPSSPMNCSNSVPLSVPECYINLAPTPTGFIEAELGHKSFIDITSFWDRFFEGKAWSDQTKRVWESYENYKNDTNPKNFRLNLAEQGVWDWLALFNNLFLSQLSEVPSLPSEHFPSLSKKENDLPLRGKICLSTRIGLCGKEAQGQLDFHIKSIGLPIWSDDWSKVRVLAGLSAQSAEYGRKVRFIQLATYVSEIFCAQPLRRFVHGFCLFDKEIEFWLIDRTGAYSSGLISIENDEQTMVRAICSYLLMSDEELGLDTTVRQVDERSMIIISDGEPGKTREIEIDPSPIIRPGKLISCGTTCYRSIDDELLVEYSWRELRGKSEMNLPKVALRVRGETNLVALDTIHKCTEFWEELYAVCPERWNLIDDEKLSEDFEEHEPPGYYGLKDYELNRVVFSPNRNSLGSYTSVLQFLTVIRNAFMGHRRLNDEKKINYSDNSEDNIVKMVLSENSRSKGILIKQDHSISNNDCRNTRKSLSQIFTIKFMAIEPLKIAAKNRTERDSNFNSTYLHDLESFFYVFITGCVEYGRDRSIPFHNLDSWCTENMDDNLKNKLDEIESNFKNFINFKFSSSFVDVKNLALELHRLLFGNTRYCHEYSRDSNLMYTRMMMAFNRTIGQIEGKIAFKTPSKCYFLP